MKQGARAISPDEIGTLIGLGAILLGAGLYTYPALLAGFPINDGGLFYTMIRAIQENGFRLPDYVQYNGLSIPFVYPPLGFYVGAAVSTLLRVDPLVVLQWLPAVTLIGISIVFYFLAVRILGSRIEAGIATFLYVSTPRSMTWLVMGGGLTRGLGQLLLMLTVLNVYALFTDGRRRYLILSMITGALVVMTHPEASLHAAASCVLIWLWKGRSRNGTLRAAAVGLGVTLLSAVWWLPRLLHFGPAPFASAAQTGLQPSILSVYPLLFTFTEEPTIGLIAALGVIGILACLARRSYFLPAWMFLPFLVEPRGAQTVPIVPLAMMASIGASRVLYPALSLEGSQGRVAGPGRHHAVNIIYVVAGYFSLFLLVMATYAALQLSQIRLSEADHKAFAWAAANTPPSSRFLILTGDTEPFCDPVQEWFPALTKRVSETTIQGYEWQSNGAFFNRFAHIQDLQRCLGSPVPVACLQSNAFSLGVGFDYAYVETHSLVKQMCRPVGNSAAGAMLASSLGEDRAYSKVFDESGVQIFQVLR